PRALDARAGVDLPDPRQHDPARRCRLRAPLSPRGGPAQRLPRRRPREGLRRPEALSRPDPGTAPASDSGGCAQAGVRAATPSVATPRLRYLPLGGLGEVGINMWALEWQGSILVVDAGLMFPQEDMPGVDLVLPDISYLLQREKDVVGIVLTHGHEDHIGGLPFALKKLNVPVYGTRLTLGLFGRLGDAGVLLLLSDSTNAERQGRSGSERDLHSAFEKIFSEAPGRIVVANFASNIHRMQHLVRVAAQFDRKVAIVGRSL